MDEELRRINDVVNVHWAVVQREAGKENFGALDRYSEEFLTLKTGLKEIEGEILAALGYMLYVELPHKFVLSYLQVHARDV